MEDFKHIKRVKAPSQLWKKVEAKIQTLENNRVPNKWYWLAAASFALLFSVNVFLINKSQNHDISINQYIESMNLANSNQLYND